MSGRKPKRARSISSGIVRARRPGRRQCLGLLWVVKMLDDRIEAYCPTCGDVEAVVSGWQDTMWSDGISPPIPPYRPLTDG
jgi:hypothetical protein